MGEWVIYPEDAGSTFIWNVSTLYQITQFHIPKDSNPHKILNDTVSTTATHSKYLR